MFVELVTCIAGEFEENRRSIGRRSIPSKGFETLNTEEVLAIKVSVIPDPYTIESPKNKLGFFYKNFKESLIRGYFLIFFSFF